MFKQTNKQIKNGATKSKKKTKVSSLIHVSPFCLNCRGTKIFLNSRLSLSSTCNKFQKNLMNGSWEKDVKPTDPWNRRHDFLRFSFKNDAVQ